MNEPFGKYLLVRKLAVGGMAEVFAATYEGPEGFKKNVAIKRILPHMTENSEFVTMFLDEARLVARFSHPNIVQIFELGQVGDNYFLAMELVHGYSMSKVLKACKLKEIEFPIEYGCKIVSQACEALDYAHTFTDADGSSLNLIHRDVSPQNIMLSYDGIVKVLDFGIAKAVGNIHQTRSSSLKGKAAYMSPEQITQKGGLDHRSDIFSLGIVLYEFVTGQRPFEGSTEFDLMMSIVQQQIPDPRLIMPNLPNDLAEIILHALDKDRERRYQSAREMRDDLEKFLLTKKFVVDRNRLAVFLEEILPASQRPGLYSSPTPSAPSVRKITPSSEPKRSPAYPSLPFPQSETDGKSASPQTGDEDHPTVMTPSEVIRPLIDAKRAVEKTHPGPSEFLAPKRRMGPSNSLRVLGLAVLVLIGGFAAYIVLGQKSKEAQHNSSKKDSQNPTLNSDGMNEPLEKENQTQPSLDGGLASTSVDSRNSQPTVSQESTGTKEAKVSNRDETTESKEPQNNHEKKKPNSKRLTKKIVSTEKNQEASMVEPKAVEVITPQSNQNDPAKPNESENATKLAVTNLGSLMINSQPWTEVYINNTSYGSTPLDGPIELDAGVYSVKLTNPKLGIVHNQRIKILAGKQQRIQKSFGKGFLQVFVMPFGEVFVNGASRGITPLEGPIELYEGVHTLTVISKHTGKERSQQVTIESGKTKTVKVDLR